MAPRKGGPPERLSDVLASLLRKRRFAPGLELEGLRQAWTRAAGDRLGGRARVAQFRDGVLTMEVSSAAQKYELEAFHAAAILTRLQADTEVPPIRRLAFKLGNRSI